MKLTIAAAQFTASDDKAANARQIVTLLQDAAACGASIVVFPEASMAPFGSPLAEVAEPLDGKFASTIRAAAREAGVVAIVGMFTPADDGRVRNTTLVTGPGVEAHYDKIHLFDTADARESAEVQPGDELVVVDVGAVTVGLATCYDLRFADQFTALGRLGSDVICVGASWAAGDGKAEQWDTLVRARAMDAQAWLVATDQAFTPPRGPLALGIGRSAVVGPLGQVAERLGDDPGLLVTTIDLDEVPAVREHLPILD